MGPGRHRGGPAPARSAPPVAARCRRSEELGAAAAAGPAVTGQAGIATGRGLQPQWQEAAAAGTVAAAGVAAVASEAAAGAEEEAPREEAAGSQEAGAPGPDRR